MASVTKWSVALLALSFFDYPLLTVCGNVKRNCREAERFYNQTNNNIQDPQFDFLTKMLLRSIAQDYRQDLDSRCAGQDQCSLGTHDCNPNAYCHKTHLAYNCECKPGYDGDGVICATIDECATNTHNCHRDAICKDLTPLFTCTCKLGYQGDGKNCTSINECSLNTHNCSKNAICTDLTPYFTCHCKPGYRGNGFKCTDIDECREGLHNCTDKEECINTGGTYHCKCYMTDSDGQCLECALPLGLERRDSILHVNGPLQDSRMTASSEEDNYPAHSGRLNEAASAWCPKMSALQDPVLAKSQYLQIDLITLKRIHGITIQGLEPRSVVKMYQVYYAVDPGSFRIFRNKQTHEIFLFYGIVNDFPSIPSSVWLFDEWAIVARYIRLNPQKWAENQCMRVELYGCEADCTSPLGMQTGGIKNNQLEVSSEAQGYEKDHSRLQGLGWCALTSSVIMAPGKVPYHYLQIDLLVPHFIRGVGTQGKRTVHEQPEAVTSFYLLYSFIGDEWFRYHTLLEAEYHGNSITYFWLDPPLVTRLIRFNPQSSRSPEHVCMRVEIYGCFYKSRSDLTNYLALGMESHKISDRQLSASSQVNGSYSALYARLNHNLQGGAWIPEKSDRSEYLQIDLGWVSVLTGIATQGHPEQPYRTLTYKLRHTISLDEAFTTYPKEFFGNVEEESTMYEVLDPTRCRYLRVQTLGWSEKVSLRVELYGYKEECSDHLRSIFSASTNAGFSLPGYGYLHSGLGSGAWCAQEHNVNQYLQPNECMDCPPKDDPCGEVAVSGGSTAKLPSESIVTGVATQGQKSSDSWVTYFSLDYSIDDRAWIQYAGGKVITGNVDRNSTVFHFFSTSLVTRYLRFHPQIWHNKICMRVGIYGCAGNDRRAVLAGRPADVSDCAVCNVNARCISSQGNIGRCVCKHGFVGDGKNCEDRDECSSSISPCPEQADCENALGSFRCLCRPGYKATDSQNSSCVDIDECKISGSCFRVGCINFPGSFKCDCGITGLFYDPQDRNCKDIDECSDGSFECNPLASCINTYGSYACICPDGYKGGGRRVCADVNECRRRPNPCGNTTVCQNTKGSYRCGCRAGFIWQNNTCIDIDECSTGAFKCRVHTECVNTIGAYTCKCKRGFYSNGPHCLDFNECLRGSADCHENAWCTNTAGSYKCFCKEGYHGNGTSCEKDE